MAFLIPVTRLAAGGWLRTPNALVFLRKTFEFPPQKMKKPLLYSQMEKIC